MEFRDGYLFLEKKEKREVESGTSGLQNRLLLFSNIAQLSSESVTAHRTIFCFVASYSVSRRHTGKTKMNGLRYLQGWIGVIGLTAFGNTISCFVDCSVMAERVYTVSPDQGKLSGGTCNVSTFEPQKLRPFQWKSVVSFSESALGKTVWNVDTLSCTCESVLRLPHKKQTVSVALSGVSHLCLRRWDGLQASMCRVGLQMPREGWEGWNMRGVNKAGNVSWKHHTGVSWQEHPPEFPPLICRTTRILSQMIPHNLTPDGTDISHFLGAERSLRSSECWTSSSLDNCCLFRVYNLTLASFVVALLHFVTETFIYKTCTIESFGVFTPIIISGESSNWDPNK